jgi:DNA-directed RNA polymerase specialized sigma24 family protein
MDTTTEQDAAKKGVEAARKQLAAAEKALIEASSNYREAVRNVRRTCGSERQAAKLLGISQTALRDLLHPRKRTR